MQKTGRTHRFAPTGFKNESMEHKADRINESTATVSTVGAYCNTPLHKDLPEGWVWKTMGEICNTTSGGTPSRAIKEYFKGNIPWVKSGELPDGLIIKTEEYITEEAVKNSSAKIFPSGTLLIAMYGATVGKLGIINREATTNQAVCAIFPHKELDTKYLFWYLKSLRADLISKSLGGAQPNISQGILRNIPIPLAPLDQQKLIVAEIEKQFSRLDEAVAALKRIQANLKRYKASVLKAAVEGKLTEQWRKEHPDVEPASELLKRILDERRRKWEEDYIKKYVGAHVHTPKDDSWKKKYKEPASPDTSNLPELPKGWIWATAEQLCGFITKGTTPSATKLYEGAGEVQFLKVYNLTFTGQLNYKYKPAYVSRATHEEELARSRVIPGDILINIVGPPLGQVSIVPEALPEANINQAIARFRRLGEMSGHYFAIALMSKEVMGWAIKRAKTTAGQANLTLELCRALPVPLPPLSEQKNLAKEVEHCFSIAEEIEDTIGINLKRSDRLRQSIFKTAFLGKLI